MGAIDEFDRNWIGYVETTYIWPLIDKVTCFFNKHKLPAFVSDSTAIRAFTGLSRDIGDIDFVVPLNIDRMFLVNAFCHAFDANFERAMDADKNVIFIRFRIPIPIKYRNQYFFMFDFHLGGIAYKGSHVWHLHDGSAFRRAKQREVLSMAKDSKTLLPILPLEETLAIKLHKYIGHDKFDILAGLASPAISIDGITSHITDIGRAKANALSITENIEDFFEAFVIYYGEDAAEALQCVPETLNSLIESLS